MTVSIPRPSVEIVRLPSGKTTYSVSADHWTNEYHRTQFLDEAETKKKAKHFVKMFNDKAKAIEDGSERPYNIMGSLVQHGWFRSIRKEHVDPSTF